MPVESTAGPETRTRISGCWAPGSPATTSSTSTSNVEISVPWMTDRPVHFIPFLTCERGMIGSAARAGTAAASEARTVATATRRTGIARHRTPRRWPRARSPPTLAAVIAAMRYSEGRLEVIDQTVLPHEERWVELRSVADAVDAIRRLAVRGAPLIGIVAAWALALELRRDPEALDAAAAQLRAARPTAVNLAWAVDRVAAAALRDGADGALAQAAAIQAEQEAANTAIGEHGAALLAGTRRVLTHCNTGVLACGGQGGTALAVIAAPAARGPGEGIAGETPPLPPGGAPPG